MSRSIAVVIPCHDHGVYLEECVGSVLASDPLPNEICVVDDGSSDRHTIEVLDRVGKMSGIVRVVRQKNLGLPAARNKGVAETSADFVFFLDADDLLDRAALRIMADFLEQQPRQIGYVYGDCHEFQEKDIVVQLPDEINPYHLCAENGLTAAVLIRRAVFDAGFAFDELLTQGFEDWEFWLRLSLNGIYGKKAHGAITWYRRRGYSMLSFSLRRLEAGRRSIHAANNISWDLLSELKRRWAPAIAARTRFPGLEQQTFRDLCVLDELPEGPISCVPGCVLSLAPSALSAADPTLVSQVMMFYRNSRLGASGVVWIESDGATAGALISFPLWDDLRDGRWSKHRVAILDYPGLPPDEWASKARADWLLSAAMPRSPEPAPPLWPTPHRVRSAEAEPLWPVRKNFGRLLLAGAGTRFDRLSAAPERIVWLGEEGLELLGVEIWDVRRLKLRLDSFLPELCARATPASVHVAADEALHLLPAIREAIGRVPIIMELKSQTSLSPAVVGRRWDGLIDAYICDEHASAALLACRVSPSKVWASAAGIGI